MTRAVSIIHKLMKGNGMNINATTQACLERSSVVTDHSIRVTIEDFSSTLCFGLRFHPSNFCLHPFLLPPRASYPPLVTTPPSTAFPSTAPKASSAAPSSSPACPPGKSVRKTTTKPAPSSSDPPAPSSCWLFLRHK